MNDAIQNLIDFAQACHDELVRRGAHIDETPPQILAAQVMLSTPPATPVGKNHMDSEQFKQMHEMVYERIQELGLAMTNAGLQTYTAYEGQADPNKVVIRIEITNPEVK